MTQKICRLERCNSLTRKLRNFRVVRESIRSHQLDGVADVESHECSHESVLRNAMTVTGRRRASRERPNESENDP